MTGKTETSEGKKERQIQMNNISRGTMTSTWTWKREARKEGERKDRHAARQAGRLPEREGEMR